MSDYESNTSSILRIGISPYSHLPPIDHDHLELEFISLSNYSDIERVSEDFLERGTSSSGSLEALLADVGGEVNHVEVLMPHLILIEEEIQDYKQRR